jgi:hypothetical protein
VNYAALFKTLEVRAEGIFEKADEVGVGGAGVEEEGELRGERSGELELGGEGVELDFFGAVM